MPRVPIIAASFDIGKEQILIRLEAKPERLKRTVLQGRQKVFPTDHDKTKKVNSHFRLTDVDVKKARENDRRRCHRRNALSHYRSNFSGFRSDNETGGVTATARFDMALSFINTETV